LSHTRDLSGDQQSRCDPVLPMVIGRLAALKCPHSTVPTLESMQLSE
jgi:hypothetical protein